MSVGGRRRDRDATASAILEAVGAVLARDGFGRLGINAVAREAGIDKVLIYRYFGGMGELLRAFGERGEFWPTDAELTGPDPNALAAMAPAARWATIATNALTGIRRRPLTHEILAWEMVESNELTAVLEEIREAQFERFMTAYGGDLEPDSRIPEVLALTVAATNYLLARRRTIRTFAGLDLHDEATWAGLEATVAYMVRSAR